MADKTSMRGVFLLAGLLLLAFWGCSGPTAAARGIQPAAKPVVEAALQAFAAELVQQGEINPDAVYTLLKGYLALNPGIYGAALAFAPVEKNGRTVKTAPYVYRSGALFMEKNLYKNYDYSLPSCLWYAESVQKGRPVWSAPYFDRGGGETWMITYSIPLYTPVPEARLIGVVTSDVQIE